MKITTTTVPTITRTGAGRAALPLTAEESAVVEAIRDLAPGGDAIAFEIDHPADIDTGSETYDDDIRKYGDSFLRHVRSAFKDQNITVKASRDNLTFTMWVVAGKIRRPRRNNAE